MSDQPDISRPARPHFDATKIPAQLRELPQWAAWKYVWRDDAWAKLPIDVKVGTAAKSTEPSTWSTFDEALRFYQESDDLDGLMFAISADCPFAGIDIDKCIDGAGNIAPTALEIATNFASYSEISPSGTGFKIWIVGKKKKELRCRSKVIPGVKEVEVYDHARFFVVTGNHLPETPLAIEERQPNLNALLTRLWPPKAKPLQPPHAFQSLGHLDDDTVIRRALKSRSGEKVRRLLAGDVTGHSNDDSGADLALCNFLAFWTNRDPAQMDRIFRTTGLYRTKWDSPRGASTYGRNTIQRAIDDCTSTYSSHKPRAALLEDVQEQELVPGAIHSATGKLVLDQHRTLPTARAFLEEFYSHPDGCRLVYYEGEFHVWYGNRFMPLESGTLKQDLQRWLHAALAITESRQGTKYLTAFKSNPKSVQNAFDAICAECHVAQMSKPRFWIGDQAGKPPAQEVVCFRSSCLHLPSMRQLDPTPAFFSRSALPFDYDPDAPKPAFWLAFLAQIFEGDVDTIALLQEIVGYLIGPDTNLHKIFLFIGVRRAGKGVIGDIITALIGVEQVASPTTQSLAQQFAFEEFHNRALALISDARFGSPKETVAILELLLTVSGGGMVDLNRKYRNKLTARLPIRFLVLTNEVPMFRDASNALAGRLVIVRFTKSFLGNEDTRLTEKLLTELPGIFNWALEGYRRVRAKQQFTEPPGNAAVLQRIEEVNSPVQVFVRECCELGAGLRVTKRVLYEHWGRWCVTRGIEPTSDAQFGKDLSAAFPQIDDMRAGNDRVPTYVNVTLKGEIQ